jgi:hypothetical protein
MLDTVLLQLLYIANACAMPRSLSRNDFSRGISKGRFSHAPFPCRGGAGGLVFAESTVMAQLGGGSCPT